LLKIYFLYKFRLRTRLIVLRAWSKELKQDHNARYATTHTTRAEATALFAPAPALAPAFACFYMCLTSRSY